MTGYFAKDVPAYHVALINLSALSGWFGNGQEDQELMKLITAQGLTEASPLSAVASVDFNAISQQLNLGRTAKQCRDRWKNYLRGGIKKGGWSKDEEELIKVSCETSHWRSKHSKVSH